MTALADPYTDQRRRAAETYGLTPSYARSCPRLVAGLRCLADDRCICVRHASTLDHPRMWLDREGRRVFTAEPYEADGSRLSELIAEIEALGLGVTVSGRSIWNPAATFILLVTREDAERN